jgi:hypothetical protein
LPAEKMKSSFHSKITNTDADEFPITITVSMYKTLTTLITLIGVGSSTENGLIKPSGDDHFNKYDSAVPAVVAAGLKSIKPRHLAAPTVSASGGASGGATGTSSASGSSAFDGTGAFGPYDGGTGAEEFGPEDDDEEEFLSLTAKCIDGTIAYMKDEESGEENVLVIPAESGLCISSDKSTSIHLTCSGETMFGQEDNKKEDCSSLPGMSKATVTAAATPKTRALAGASVSVSKAFGKKTDMKAFGGRCSKEGANKKGVGIEVSIFLRTMCRGEAEIITVTSDSCLGGEWSGYCKDGVAYVEHHEEDSDCKEKKRKATVTAFDVADQCEEMDTVLGESKSVRVQAVASACVCFLFASVALML